MVKTLVSLATALSLAAALILAPEASASTANPLGKVDTKRLFEQYREAQLSQSEFKKKAESYQRKFMNRNQELQDAQREGKTKAEIEKMTKRYEAELRPEKEAVEKLDKELSAKLKRQIETAIQDVAKAKGYSVVVDKQVVLFGGEDITDEVLKKLNK
ncbi:MAG: OmpH family outer membrane protein [Candidatus Sericytochromatia bacterium]|uniref:OmpH family outer membrane protein n=1 Tax=Candidatus Tanganyikabacteria bacterium TaxID=2961651 RepID=A0A938BP06_9BACT|nr:OmpH family outer membrane protein [Candidatus Tanganyikabacteria bacterium]